jgi:hypothetical protein
MSASPPSANVPLPEATVRAALAITPVPSTPSLRSRRAPDRLAEEVEILGRAASALGAGRSAEGLEALNEHQTQFPNGALAEERRAAKVEALCSLGRFPEAQSELVKLERTSPQSPISSRARQLCKARSPTFR